MKTRRLLELLYYLDQHEITSAAILAAHFEVSQRTIIRDMDQLLIAGYPIQTYAGRNGGYTLDKDYRLPVSLLTKDDHQTLSSLIATLTLHPSTSLSIQSQFNQDTWFEYDFSSWGTNDQSLFTLVRTHIQQQTPYIFEYINSRGQRRVRTTLPKKLIYKDRFWYLKAMDLENKEERLFKLRRMIQPSASFEVPEHWLSIELTIDESQLFKILDECEILSITPASKSKLIVKFACPNSAWIIDFILSFGSQAEVLSPLNLRQEIIHHLKNALILYEENETTLL